MLNKLIHSFSFSERKEHFSLVLQESNMGEGYNKEASTFCLFFSEL
jgi:hypothetical protein